MVNPNDTSAQVQDSIIIQKEGDPAPPPLVKSPDDTPSNWDPKIPQPTEDDEFIYLLYPSVFKEKFPELFARLYPGNVKIVSGTPIIANEYILVDDEPTLRFMENGGEFDLLPEDSIPLRIQIKVEKYRHCGGKALVLISSEEDLSPLYELPLNEQIKVVPVHGTDATEGYIRPGGRGSDGGGQDGNTNTVGRGQDGNTNTVGRGQDGNTNTVGRGQGQPNAYGLSYAGSRTTGGGVLSRDDLRGTDANLKVAVLDSGIRFTDQQMLAANSNENVAESCVDAVTGWNFVKDNGDIDDTQSNFHGTRVASIIRSVCKEATIIPVRVSNENNVCTLYDVLCGLEYAAQQRVRIINASIVFSSTQGMYIPLLQASLRRLAFQGILVVCAAGNIGPVQAQGLDAIPHIGESKGDGPFPFLSPACSSEALENVITVTSVADIESVENRASKKRAVCEMRSRRFISVGVLANGNDAPFGSFQSPDFNPFRGTSFATPYVTGQIAKAMSSRADLSSRKAILRAIGARRDFALFGQIRQGMWMTALPKVQEA